MDLKETKKDYNNVMEEKKKLEVHAAQQNEEIKQLNQKLAQLGKEREEYLRQQSKNDKDISSYKQAKLDYINQGRAKLEDLNKQLEEAKAEQNQRSQIDQNVNQEPKVSKLEIKSKQSQDQNGKLKVEIKFDNNYTQIEIQEKLLADQKSVELFHFILFQSQNRIAAASQIERINLVRWT